MNAVDPVWFFGRDGQLGFYLSERLGARGVGFGRDDFDQSRPEDIEDFLDARLRGGGSSKKPAAVINAAAYTKVDLAETETTLCDRVNVETPGRLAVWAARQNVPFIHYSTDYVYSGESKRPWHEADAVQPINYYGLSKLRGEQQILKANPSALIFRTSWVYSHRRPCFVLAVLKKAREQKHLTLVSDQTGSPTYADHLAELTLAALDTHPHASGIFHLCDEGYVSRLDFARAILDEAARFEPHLHDVELTPVLTKDMPSAARRPLNSRLDLSKTRRELGLNPRPWRENLIRCLERHYADRNADA